MVLFCWRSGETFQKIQSSVQWYFAGLTTSIVTYNIVSIAETVVSLEKHSRSVLLAREGAVVFDPAVCAKHDLVGTNRRKGVFQVGHHG